MSARYLERLATIEKVLLIENKVIDMNLLRQGCLYGIPEPLRPLAWRLLLNYLPSERSVWKEFLTLQRDNYDSLVDQMIVQPGAVAPKDDHPLSENTGSTWADFFEDNLILSQIDKDVRRLRPEIQFFQLRTKYPHKSSYEYSLSSRVARVDLESQECDPSKNKTAKRKSSLTDQDSCETHWQVLERILFIYAKLNPGVKYGMNEVLGPIYYCLASDSDQEWAEFAEPDAFFCFQQLMSEIKDVFIKTLDNSSCGIESSMLEFHDLVSSFDPPLYKHLVQDLSIKPQFYAFRWISLLLSQEFSLPDVITIWDSLLSDPKRFSLLHYVCLAMLEHKRLDLLNADFAESLKLLQDYPDSDVSKLVIMAVGIRDGTVPSVRSNGEKSRFAKHTRSLSDKIKDFGFSLRR
ncbi:unnamed protein product [Auanema sp. JU1783]|nr:unnamed protein product [Auanema sp. JU1783]